MKFFTLQWMGLAAALMCSGCRSWESRKEDAKALPPSAVTSGTSIPALPKESRSTQGGLRYARVFTVSRIADTTVLQVLKPWQGATADFTYKLVHVDSGKHPPAEGSVVGDAPASGLGVFKIPVARAITLTTSNLHHLETLGVLDALVGLGSGRYVCGEEVRARLRSGRILDVGEDMRLDAEAVVSLKPDMLFTYVVGNSSDGGLAKLAETGIPFVIEGSYMEETPLGRAEWIKFTAAFFDKEAEADSAFAEIDSAYRSLTALARTAKRRPTVFVGAPFGGVWWVPSGRTYVGQLLADAGADYLWASDTTRGSLNLDLEAVLGRAGGADIWLNAGDWNNLDDAVKQDPRNALFKAFREGRVYTNDAIRCEGGGRDFYETGASRPDWILADLISILHPDLLPGHQPRWYRKLGKAK
ncbi:MAG: ABC transporter substrate-binding protein [Fibrobacterota bacterium]|nr:ABC transporter substrate-binding protein [Fibrobacterota bacterium]